MSPSHRMKLVASVAALVFGTVLMVYVAWSAMQPEALRVAMTDLSRAYEVEDGDRVFGILAELTAEPPPLIIEAMVQALEEGSGSERIAVCRAIGDLDQFYDLWPVLRQPELLAALQQLVLDTAQPAAVRVAALAALKVERDWSRTNLPLLVTIVDDRASPAGLRREAMIHLGRAGEAANDLLPMLMQDIDRAASDATYPGDQLWQTLVEINPQNPRVQELVFQRAAGGQQQAIYLLPRLADRERAMAALHDLLQREDMIAGDAIEVFRRMGPDAAEAVPALLELRTRHPSVAIAAVEAIGEIGVVTDAQLATLRALEDEDWYWEVVDIIDHLARKRRELEGVKVVD